MFDEALVKLDDWVRENGWEGYDPYDIKGMQPFMMFAKARPLDYVSSKALSRFPMVSRRFFRVRKEVNAKAMGLFSKAYIRLHASTSNQEHKELAMESLDWLYDNASPGYSGKCWGYPFHWQARVFIPRGTPSVVVSSVGAHAFMDAYQSFGKEKYLDVARSVCDFILNDLNRDENSDGLCFSYTPLDNFHVHNANLFGASVLARVGSETGERDLMEMAQKSIKFTLNHQNKDGSFYYWAPPDKMLNLIDNYHTGFVLECLNVCRRAMGDKFLYNKQLKRGLNFYARELFTEKGEARISTKSMYPINIHSCAQGIITFKELADFDSANEPLAKKIAAWTVENMQDSSGYFYHAINEGGRVDKTPYIRWGQAWMLLALSHLA